MNERTQISVGLILLIFCSAVILLYALPVVAPIPAILAVFAALGMSAGTLLVGTSKKEMV